MRRDTGLTMVHVVLHACLVTPETCNACTTFAIAIFCILQWANAYCLSMCATRRRHHWQKGSLVTLNTCVNQFLCIWHLTNCTNSWSQQLDPTTEPERNAFTQRVLASTLWHDGFYSQVTDGSSSTAIPQM